jgi:hypothetical protein
VRFIAEGASRTRVELEHRRLDRYGERRDEMRTIFDKTGDWGQLLAAFAQSAAALAKPQKARRYFQSPDDLRPRMSPCRITPQSLHCWP